MKVSPFSWLALSFFGYYCAYGVFVPFFPVWLKSQQYGSEMIGLILASSYLFRFVGGLFFSSQIKHSHQLISALRLLAFVSAIIMGGLSFVTESFWLLFTGIGLFAMVNAGGMPLTDSLASTWQRQINLDYGKARLIGSIAFVVGVTVFGNIIGLIGETNIVWILTAIFCLYAILQWVSPTILPIDENTTACNPQVSFIQLLKNNTTLRILLASSLIQGSHATYYVYSTLYWTSMGISVGQTSLLWALGVCAEIALFFFSRRLLQNLTVSTIFYLSAVGAVIRWTGLALSYEFLILCALQLLHSLTYATGHYAMVRYITMQPQAYIAKLQGLYNGLSNSAMVAILTVLSGWLYNLSPSTAFFAMAISAALALLVIPPKVAAFLHRAKQ